MLQREFHAAERLAQDNDEAALKALHAAYDRKVTRAALLGLVSLLGLLFGEWILNKIDSELAAPGSWPRTVLLGAASVGIFLYFVLSKRFTDARDRVTLAIELKGRETSPQKEG
jgi:hypothetical protein